MEEAKASDNPGQEPPRTEICGEMTREARKRWKQRHKKKKQNNPKAWGWLPPAVYQAARTSYLQGRFI